MSNASSNYREDGVFLTNQVRSNPIPIIGWLTNFPAVGPGSWIGLKPACYVMIVIAQIEFRFEWFIV